MFVMARLRGQGITAAALTAGLACATGPGFVDATSFAPTLVVELRYATRENFIGTRVDGYEAPLCLLSVPAARALAAAQGALEADGLGLIVWDCYRPQRAVDHFVRWSREPAEPSLAARHHPNVAKSELFARGYIAARSGHSRGSTVDVGLVRLADGALLDCGTPFDFFDSRSHVDADVPTEARRHRQILQEAMQANGWATYPEEWWHFTLRNEPYPDTYFDDVVR
jgi:D-alanyl-D-alanine dipeptidase